jgi:hypothetical protein
MPLDAANSRSRFMDCDMAGFAIDLPICKKMTTTVRVGELREEVVSLPDGWNFLIELVYIRKNICC